MLKKIQKKEESTRKYIYRTIKQSIIDFYFLPGDKLDEQAIAKELNVSRTPVREALILLENENLLTILPKKGTFVSKIDLTEAHNFLAMKSMMEQKIISNTCLLRTKDDLIDLEESLNAQKVLMKIKDSQLSLALLDKSYHKLIYKISGHVEIWNSLQRIGNSYNRIRSLIYLQDVDFDIFYQENLNLFKIIESQNLQQLEKFFETYLNLLDTFLPALIEEYPHYFND